MVEGIKKNFFELIKANLLIVVLFSFGVIFLIYGLASFLGSTGSSADQIIIDSEEVKKETKISVDVEGAVIRPGVYSISASSRIQDALIAAGGFDQTADREWVAKNLNLALKIQDGAKIYIPREGEQAPAFSSGTISNISELININTADEASLDTLPGVGKATAEKIIAQRPYLSLEDLLSKKVLGASTFSKIKDKITY